MDKKKVLVRHTQKHINFVSEGIKDKLVTKIPGVGDLLGKKLATAGYDKAYILVGQYLMFRKNRDVFENWLKENFSATSQQSAECYEAIKDWCDQFMD